MKVRFSNQKERDPTRDQGMKVLYAPGKRAAFRLHWYLILLLVASPFLWFVGKLFLEVALTEAPARLHLPSTDVRSMLTGRVEELHVQPGANVRTGDLMASLSSSSLSAQQQELEALLSREPIVLASESQRNSLQRRVDRARTRVNELESLVATGAATRGELSAARDQLDIRLSELAGSVQSLQPTAAQQQDLVRDRLQLERILRQMELLSVTAPGNGTVTDIAVVEGETVGAGSRLLSIRLQKVPTIEIYLQPELAELARAGQPLTLLFPDNTRIDAEITGAPQESRRLPPDLRTPFSDHQVGLVVTARTKSPLPRRWHLDNVPLTARFPSRWLAWLGVDQQPASPR